MTGEYAYIAAILLAVCGTLCGSILSIFFGKKISQSHMGTLVALAAGMMAGCSVVMFMESVSAIGLFFGIVSLMCGILMMIFLDHLVTKYIDSPNFEFSGLSGEKGIRVLILFLSLSVHSIGEGFSLGLASTITQGSVVSISLALHNIPEAAALSFAFKSKGVSDRNAMIFAILSTFPQSLFAFPIASYFNSVASHVDLALGISAGCMVWAIVHEILPEAVDQCGKRLSLTLASASAIALIAFDVYSHSQVR